MKIASVLALAFGPLVATGFQLGPSSRITQSVRTNALSARSIQPIGYGSARTPLFLDLTDLETDEFPNLDDYEAALAEIIFSQLDPREEIAQNIEKYDKKFMDWLDNKIKASSDLEERAGLGGLRDMILGVNDALEKATEELEAKDEQLKEQYMADGPAVVDVDTLEEDPVAPKSNQDVFAQMRAMQQVDDAADLEKEKARQAAIAAQIDEGYMALLNEVFQRAEGESLQTAVAAIYDKVDLKLMELIQAKVKSTDDMAERGRYAAVYNEITEIQSRRMMQAMEKLQGILAKGNPSAMTTEVARLATEGSVDEPLLLLLEANIKQAEMAGPAAADAVKVMSIVKEKAQTELDRKLDPPKRLLRRLLRTEGRDARRKIIEGAFQPKEALLMTQQEEKKAPEPDVCPPDFIAECKTLITQYGNADEDGTITARIQEITNDAEEVARGFFGNSLSPKDRQDYMWNEGSKSVFDLEGLELQAEMMGERMPWQNDKYDDMLPQEVQKEGKFDIGGDFDIGKLKGE